ncbi:MAG: DUF5320 domain-containing protein [Candidatus Aureabacteria bacterium]|nr:DUF5320 domain-containing protein [Candidatus Auribacterota bacterium]
MPGFDGTGPRGMGPMTGGGRGFCVLPAERVYARPYGARPFSRGAGRGRGWRNWYYATGLPGWMRAGYTKEGYPDVQEMNPDEEISALQKEASFLKQQMEEIQKRISTLERSEQDKA